MAYSLKENLMKEDRLSGGHRMCAAAALPSRCGRCCVP